MLEKILLRVVQLQRCYPQTSRKEAIMQINTATTLASQEMGNNKAQSGLDLLTRTLAKAEPGEQLMKPVEENSRAAMLRDFGKGQNIDIKV
ncbi:MAG: hypothetical protein GW875_04540 [Deltaproteobacteria bacterium]|nr:hypothetical protein [Deltaproteobacteria bacterium]NCP02030.1 hypothetical protein [Deltaproteobacteria bacterium]